MSNRVIDTLRTAEAIARWKAAEAFLDRNGGFLIPTAEYVHSLVGHGITSSEAEDLIDLARSIAQERNRRPA